jgi:HD-GYP domain-containing protein (c-di-GMP phosphodiesterase class II)
VRPYRPALSQEAAAAELQRGTGAQFEPSIVEAFLRLLERGEISTVGAAEVALAATN